MAQYLQRLQLEVFCMLTPQNLSFSDADQFLLDSLKTAVVLLDEELRVRYLKLLFQQRLS